MLKKKRLAIIIAVIIVVVAIGGYFIFKKIEKPIAKPNDSKLVGMIKVGLGENTSNYDLPGEFVPKFQADMGFQVSGHIVKRLVNMGDIVKAGQVLYQLETADYALQLSTANAQVASAQANLNLQTINLQRAKELLAGAAIPQSQYDSQYAQYLSARDSLNAATSQRDGIGRQVGYTDLIAPGDAVVMQIIADIGDVVNVGQGVVRLGYLKEWDAQIELGERERALFDIGTRVKVYSWVSSVPEMAGTIREISGSANTTTRTFKARITLDQRPEKLRLGMTCTVNLLSSMNEKIIFIPLEALVQDNTNKPYVWVVEDGIAHKREITLGRYGANNNIEVTSGLKPGETIINSGVITILDGSKVAKWNDQSRRLGW
ncbi:MAG: efflux RND transporter periplasmic adaptor subunit [Negativicutes bacterium]|jgi:RND family efflux transporter MFP subunit